MDAQVSSRLAGARVLLTELRLGFFDPRASVAYLNYSHELVDTPAGRFIEDGGGVVAPSQEFFRK